jgi:hypothetical protein
VTLANHFELRWRDGYGQVSDAPAALTLAIAEVAAAVTRSPAGASYVVREIRYDDQPIAVGVLRLDVAVASGPRALRYLHALALPVGFALTVPAWRALIARRYGAEPERRIRALYEDLATSTRAAGRDALRALAITLDDIALELGEPGRPAAGHAARSVAGARVAATPEPVPEVRRRPPNALLGFALALGVGSGAGWIAHGQLAATRSTGPDRALSDAWQARAAQLELASRELAQLRTRSAADLQRCGATQETIAAERRAAQVDLAAALDREQAARGELTTARAQAARVISEHQALAGRVTALDLASARLTDELARLQAAGAAHQAQQETQIQQLGDALRSACDAAQVKPAGCRAAKP